MALLPRRTVVTLFCILSWCFHKCGAQENETVLEIVGKILAKVTSEFKELEGVHSSMVYNFVDLHSKLDSINESLSESIGELQNEVDSMRVTQGEVISRLNEWDIRTRNSLERLCDREQMESLQESISTEFQEMNHLIKQCSSTNQIFDLQKLLETDVDECSLGTDRCHPNAHCTNTVGNYTCTCEIGYSGNGFTCEDVDECSTSANRCHPEAHCTNTAGNYTCECFDGYSGNGFTCEDLCAYPYQWIDGLGCVTMVRNVETWEVAKQRCQKDGSRLLEGITSQLQLNQLKERLPKIGGNGKVWVGIFKKKWIEGGRVTPSSLWGSGDPDGGCGQVHLNIKGRICLRDSICYHRCYFLCQSSYPLK